MVGLTTRGTVTQSGWGASMPAKGPRFSGPSRVLRHGRCCAVEESCAQGLGIAPDLFHTVCVNRDRSCCGSGGYGKPGTVLKRLPDPVIHHEEPGLR